MTSKDLRGWKALLQGFPWFAGENRFPLAAYSEFMPPPRLGLDPITGRPYPWVFSEEDPYGWKVWEIEEELRLKPGLEEIGREILRNTVLLGSSTPPSHLVGYKKQHLSDNIFWSPEVMAAGGIPAGERYVSIVPFALSKTKDDKGLVRWTFFGASEQGPEKAFWKSFYSDPDHELPEQAFLATMKWILRTAYGMDFDTAAQLHGLGFRILPAGGHFPLPYWNTDSLPSWTTQFLATDTDSFEGVKYLLTFRPFPALPAEVRKKYVAGDLALIPFPGGLLLWGIPQFIRLQKKLYNAVQVPMLSLIERKEDIHGIRVPQSGWLHQPRVAGEKAEILEELIRKTYVRTNRWNRFQRNEDALLKSTEVDPVAETLFSTRLEVLDLYNKPMARNCQLFTESIQLLLDGPRADRKQLAEAMLKLLEGGLFRYRFLFPPMVAGNHEVIWHRPLLACLSKETGLPEVATELTTGYLTAYAQDAPDPGSPVELWPRMHRRELYLDVLDNFDPAHDHYLHQTSLNLMILLETWEFMGKRPLDADFARNLVRIPKHESLDEWLGSLTARSYDPVKTEKITRFVRSMIRPSGKTAGALEALTFPQTATRLYEEEYWNQIFQLAMGEFRYKDNADVVLDDPTLKEAGQSKRDLHKLGEYLLAKHQQAISNAGMEGLAVAGELPFKWETDFNFDQFGGWKSNQTGKEYERNLLVIIPGKNRKEALVMGDHYDTAYMEDVFNKEEGGTGARLSAAGADDNYSATATLLLAAPIFLKMAKEGRLERDIWLLHLTGEEFPSDCMGARDFCKRYVEKTLTMHLPDGSTRDLSDVEVKGVLVMDMIAHNRDNDRDVFQISPGKTEDSLHLAYAAHRANQCWNESVPVWNQLPGRKGCSPGKRTTDGHTIPGKALHLEVNGEIRIWEDHHSSLYNTDGMIFSDTGIPVILFMENYDISRTGYHDTHDTMENIDLDFGAAVSAIAIETIAQLATT
jgi:hypothetical protein